MKPLPLEGYSYIYSSGSLYIVGDRHWPFLRHDQAKRFGVRYVCHPVGNRPPYEG
jgi:hypothetical protein